jgi:hypothetical protein
MNKLVLTRDLSNQYHFWLWEEPLREGTIVYHEENDIYGCLSKDNSGLLVRLSDNPNNKTYNPAFEVPKDSVREYYGPSFSVN